MKEKVVSLVYRGTKKEKGKMMNEQLTTTLKRNVFDLTVEGIDYSVLSDLKKLHDSDEVYFNATDIIKQYNEEHPNKKRLLSTFIRRLRTKELIESLIVQFCTVEKKLIIVKGKGRYAETWLHKELFAHLLIWIDVKHEIAVVQFVTNVVKMIGNAKEIRTEEKDRHLPYTDALKVLYGRLKEEGTKQREDWFYSTIQRKIAKKATGEAMKNGGRDHDGHEAQINASIAILRGIVQRLAKDLNDIDQDFRSRGEKNRSARDDRKEIYEAIEAFTVISQSVSG